MAPLAPAATKTTAPVRVFLVDDSPVALLLLQRLLAGDAGIQVVGTARNGREAMALLQAARPDVIVTDYYMPVMNGLELVREVMEKFPRPILVVSSAVGASRDETFALLQAGAVDLFAKPQGLENSAEAAAQLAQKIRLVAGVSVISRRAASSSQPPASPLAPSTCTPPRAAAVRDGSAAAAARGESPTRPAAMASAQQRVYAGRVTSAHAIARGQTGAQLVAIGASTGGPQTLQAILSALPASFPCPILCVQHISHGFLEGLVEWLARSCRLGVRVAQDGEEARAGTIYFAPHDRHLEIGAGNCLLHSPAPPIDGHRPSASALFGSVARCLGPRAVGVLLTGMGSDGAAGLLEMARRGAATIAQDEASSVIFGMPRQAIELGAAQYVLPLDQVAPALERLAAPAATASGARAKEL